tara:strand:+ start:2026 stop:2193 length:168 start_codon:yes stop_codon:yes gene_type:complete
MKNEIRDTVEFLGINVGGIGLSLTQIDGVLRTLILLATLVYSIKKIRSYNKENEK